MSIDNFDTITQQCYNIIMKHGGVGTVSSLFLVAGVTLSGCADRDVVAHEFYPVAGAVQAVDDDSASPCNIFPETVPIDEVDDNAIECQRVLRHPMFTVVDYTGVSGTAEEITAEASSILSDAAGGLIEPVFVTERVSAEAEAAFEDAGPACGQDMRERSGAFVADSVMRGLAPEGRIISISEQDQRCSDDGVAGRAYTAGRGRYADVVIGDGGTLEIASATVVHEAGHQLGLGHWGMLNGLLPAALQPPGSEPQYDQIQLSMQPGVTIDLQDYVKSGRYLPYEPRTGAPNLMSRQQDVAGSQLEAIQLDYLEWPDNVLNPEESPILSINNTSGVLDLSDAGRRYVEVDLIAPLELPDTADQQEGIDAVNQLVFELGRFPSTDGATLNPSARMMLTNADAATRNFIDLGTLFDNKNQNGPYAFLAGNQLVTVVFDNEAGTVTVSSTVVAG